MDILIVSHPTHEGMVAANVASAIERIDCELARQKTDLVMFGELFTCGYCARDLAPFAENADGPSIRAFQDLADRRDTIVGFGFPERAGDGAVFNSYALLQPRRTPFVYRKTHLHSSNPGRIENEPEYLAAGDTLGLVDTPWGRLGLMICYDGSIVEVPRSLALRGALALLWPARSGGTLARRGVVPVRAIDNLAPVVLAENPQLGDFFPNTAHSIVCDHSGAVVGELIGEGVLRAQIDLSEVGRLRAHGTGRAGVFTARRPDLYCQPDEDQ